MKNTGFWARFRSRRGGRVRWEARKVAWLGGTFLASALLAVPVSAAIREPGLLNRDQVRSGLGGRIEQMQNRQELRLRSRDGGTRYRMNPSGRPEIRVPRDPLPAPPPASLP